MADPRLKHQDRRCRWREPFAVTVRVVPDKTPMDDDTDSDNLEPVQDHHQIPRVREDRKVINVFEES